VKFTTLERVDAARVFSTQIPQSFRSRRLDVGPALGASAEERHSL
jgi:hypothetical protein